LPPHFAATDLLRNETVITIDHEGVAGSNAHHLVQRRRMGWGVWPAVFRAEMANAAGGGPLRMGEVSVESLLLALISFGDSAIAVGILLSGTAFLAATRNLKAAAILFIAVVAAGGVIGTMKTLFIGCDLYLSDLNIRFPSGHAALSSSGLGTVCVLIINRLVGWRRAAVIALFAVAEALIATTLVVMGFHTFY
jgi:hypothetical protein